MRTIMFFTFIIFTGISLSGILSLAHTFYFTYFAPNKTVLLSVDHFNEGFVEAVFIIPSMLFSAIGSVLGTFWLFDRHLRGCLLKYKGE